MRFSVRHATHYRYSAPVRLGTHLLRLGPRPDGVDRLESRLHIDPEPRLRLDLVDRWGNRVTQVEFDGLTDHLLIDSAFEVETLAAPPPDGADLPGLPWPTVADAMLPDYLDDAGIDDDVRAFAEGLATESDGDPLAFLDRLTVTLFERTDRYIRDGGYAQTPAETLMRGAGACRDVTVLFMAAARSLGMASRFVSGYQARAETPDGRRHLHAWPEVHLPGSGWRGFDPTHGVAVEDGHVALCAAPDQFATMPVEGGFWGDGISSTLDYEVSIEADD